ncbi:MAG: FAD-dependent oxidoreductase [Candidatus Thorarchaeota archaeon]|nr:MAG: FAD-dependent oxidoreductase [Candidatus Thorarchaeota archaeon]
MKIVVVGYGPGGANAAFMARIFDPNVEVTIITQEEVEAHRKPGASMALEFPESSDLLIGDWSYAKLKERGVNILPGVKVLSGDVSTKVLEIEDSRGKKSKIEYDKLILATGGIPSVPDLPGTDLEGVFTISDMIDAKKIGEKLSGLNKIIIVGAGFSGLETAERLMTLGKEVHIIIRSRLMRRLLEEPMSLELQSRIPKDIILHIGRSPTAVLGDERVTGIALDGDEIEADAVLFMTGVRPNKKLAKSLGLEIGSRGGVKVNSVMQTSNKDIYAVGDCVELIDSMTGKPSLLPIGSAAARAGMQAGVIAVGRNRQYENIGLRLQYDRIFNTDIICVGQSSTTAADADIETEIHYSEDPAEYLKVALLTTKDGTLIGGQVLASRMGGRVAYQIMERVQSGANLKDRPLLQPRHKRLREHLEEMLGPIQ